MIIDVNLAGFSFKLDDPSGNDNVARLVQNDDFEPPLPELVAELLARSNGSFIDVGAHTGVYTILACLTRPDLSAVAFEPYPEILEICRRNLEINGLLSRVDLRPVALSDRSGTATLHIPDPSHGMLETSSSLEPDFKPAHQLLEVPVRTLDELSIEGPIAVIKVDIEGHEDAFLNGARQTIDRERPIILVEILPRARVDVLHELVIAKHYRDFRLRRDMAIRDHQVRFDNGAWNHAFVPAERMDAFTSACLAQGIEMVVRMPFD
jgi:FkbM family methyltransferase